MNERIKELIEQALLAVDNPFPGNPLNDELEKMYIPDCFAEKFAELIVRECCVWVNNNLGLVDEEAKADLLKHFGVEE